MSREATKDDIERIIKTRPAQANRVLSVLGKLTQFNNAISSPIGQELLSDVIRNMEMLLEKIVTEKADEKDRADYRAYRNIAETWMGRIQKYSEKIEELKNS